MVNLKRAKLTAAISLTFVMSFIAYSSFLRLSKPERTLIRAVKQDADQVLASAIEYADSLESLDCEEVGLSDAQIERMATHCKKLVYLRINGSQLSGDGVSSLRELDDLQTLEVVYARRSDAVSGAFKLSNLKQLAIESARIDSWIDGFGGISSTSQIRTLSLANSNVDANHLLQIATLSKLMTLNLTRCDVNYESLAVTKEFPQLRELVLNGTKIGEAGIGQIPYMSLHSLSLEGCINLDSNCFVQLSQSDSLTFLSVANSSFDDECAKFLSHNTSLTRVDISGCEVSNVAIAALASIPTLKEIRAVETSLCDADLREPLGAVKVEWGSVYRSYESPRR